MKNQLQNQLKEDIKKINHSNVDKKISDRMDIDSKNICFITLKDYKENCLDKSTVRLINLT